MYNCSKSLTKNGKNVNKQWIVPLEIIRPVVVRYSGYLNFMVLFCFITIPMILELFWIELDLCFLLRGYE